MHNKQLILSACLTAALLLCAGAALAAPPDKAKGKAPLQLETYKSFVVGGQRVTHADGTVGLSGHIYVEAFVPHRPGPAKKLPPILMLHSSITGTIFLERANGEEGWALLFARAGYPVYVVDPPGTGRASVDLTLYPGQVTQSNSAPWVDWKHGPAFGQLGFNPPNAPFDATPHPFPMNQMPTDEEGVNRWLAHRMVYSVNPGNQIRNAAFIALVEKIGEPVIWMGWSGGGSLGQELVIGRPDLFKAIAHIEGCRADLPTIMPFIETVAAHHIPVLHVNPDYGRVAGPQGFLPSGSRCVNQPEWPIDVAAEIRKRGGNALTVYLPDVGIYGNGHEYMLQNNADEIAEKVYLPWLKENVK